MIAKQPKDFVGKKINKLLVLRGMQPTKYKGTYAFATYLCRCECGAEKEIDVYRLAKGKLQSCGCERVLVNLTDLIEPGDKFNRLTVIGFDTTKNLWEYKCECGQVIFRNGKTVRNGNTKSCGCLNKEKNSEKAINLINKKNNPNPIITVATRIYNHIYRDDNLTFEQFFALSQLPCNYCGIEKSNAQTKKPSKHSYLSKLSKEELTFRYNGLDRLDSNLPHNANNCVPACYICNHAKSDMSLEAFMQYLSRLTTHNIHISTHDYKNLAQTINMSFFDDTKTNYSQINSIKFIYDACYYDADFDIKLFYQLSQLNCYYCGSEPLNLTNRAKQKSRASDYAKSTGDFRYNGLDRMNPSLPHTYDNVIPACYICNFAKNHLTFSQFQSWIARIKSFNATKTL
jgi:hypothetical protein